MSIQKTVAALRGQAAERNITLGMAKLNDAIALALYGRPYAPVIAAERAGDAPTPSLSEHPERVIQVAAKYQIDPAQFATLLFGPLVDRSDFHRAQAERTVEAMRGAGVYTTAAEALAAVDERARHAEAEFSVDPDAPTLINRATALLERVGKTMGIPAHRPEAEIRFHPTLESRLVGVPRPLYVCEPEHVSALHPYVELAEDGAVDVKILAADEPANPEPVGRGRVRRYEVAKQVNGKDLWTYLQGTGRLLLAEVHADRTFETVDGKRFGRIGPAGRWAEDQFEIGLSLLIPEDDEPTD